MSSLGKTVLVLVVATLLLSSCTLHFKATDLEIDTEHTPRILKNSETENTTYELTHIDIAKR